MKLKQDTCINTNLLKLEETMQKIDSIDSPERYESIYIRKESVQSGVRSVEHIDARNNVISRTIDIIGHMSADDRNREIRFDYRRGLTQSKISQRYGISQSQVSRIIRSK